MCIRDSFGAVFTPEGKSELANPSSNNTNGSYTFLGELTGNPLADFMLNYASNYTETALDPFGKYRWFNLEPVSYTHLDVYKRQGFASSLLPSGVKTAPKRMVCRP